MNCIELFALKSQEAGNEMAFVGLEGGECSFLELRDRVSRAQKYLLSQKFSSGDSVLLAIAPSIDLYATVIAVLGLGGSLVLVEPWMPVERIAEVIQLVCPKVFITGFLGSFWGMRVRAIREIPLWVRPHQLFRHKGDGLKVMDVDPKTPGIITFTTGTSGTPKGVVREQGYLVDQFMILKKSLHTDLYKGSDLCIFANWTLINLAQGKPTVFFPAKWSAKNFSKLNEAAAKYKIETMTAGPAFAAELLKREALPFMKEIHIGGALTPNSLFENLFSHFKDAQFFHLYGSSEVEPVCVTEAKKAVKKSRERDFYHTLFLGSPIPEIAFDNRENGMWVSGAHVCPFYLNNQRENELNKRKDDLGVIWHFMGDRIEIDQDKQWWYQGRSQLLSSDFLLEQKIYQFLGHDRAFVHIWNGARVLVGEGVKEREGDLKKEFPYLDQVLSAVIQRDIRHRARIDRAATLKHIKGKG